MTDQDTAPGADTRRPDAPPAGPEEGAGQGLQEALAHAEATAQENWNKYLRAAAELDNVRKRTLRDVEQARKFGIERFASELLPVLDSLEMGLEADASASPKTLLEGKQATLRLLKATLEKFGVAEIVPTAQAFDPQVHEALSIQPAPDAEPGSVIAVVQKGYQLNGRLLRPARVIVADSGAGNPANGQEPADA